MTKRKGYRIHTRNTEYLLVCDDEEIWTIEAVSEPRTWHSLSRHFMVPVVVGFNYFPEVGKRFSFYDNGHNWPKVSEAESPISTSDVQKIEELTKDELRTILE